MRLGRSAEARELGVLRVVVDVAGRAACGQKRREEEGGSGRGSVRREREERRRRRRTDRADAIGARRGADAVVRGRADEAALQGEQSFVRTRREGRGEEETSSVDAPCRSCTGRTGTEEGRRRYRCRCCCPSCRCRCRCRRCRSRSRRPSCRCRCHSPSYHCRCRCPSCCYRYRCPSCRCRYHCRGRCPASGRRQSCPGAWRGWPARRPRAAHGP